MEKIDRGEPGKHKYLQRPIYENITVRNDPTKTVELVGLLSQMPLYTRDGINVYEHTGQLINLRQNNRPAVLFDAEQIDVKIRGVITLNQSENKDQMMKNLVTRIRNVTRIYKHPLLLICNNRVLNPLLTFRQNRIKAGDTINVVVDELTETSNTMVKTEEGPLIYEKMKGLKTAAPKVDDGGPYQYVVLRFQSNDLFLHGLLEKSTNITMNFKQ